MKAIGVNTDVGPTLEQVVEVQVERAKNLKEMAENSRYFYEDVSSYDEKAAKKHLKPEIVNALAAVKDKLHMLPVWNKELIHAVVIETAAELELKLGKLAQPIRVAMTGNTVSPSIDAVLFLIGKERVLVRLQQAIDFALSQAQECTS